MPSSSSSALAAPVAVLALALAACTRTEPQATVAPDGGIGTAADKTTISLKGSDTMVILGQRWAETFMKANPGITIAGGGKTRRMGFALGWRTPPTPSDG